MNAQDMPIGGATTTEELIVQYLDGELLRKELEMVLFERLATNAEARQLLREHLVIRGAIRDSYDDQRFQLSSDLDDRTRARIEEALKALPTVAAPAAPDAVPVRIDPTRRRLDRWAVRPAYAALLLVFAVAATWFATHSADTKNTTVAMKAPEQTQPNIAATERPATATAPKSEAPTVIVKEKIVEKPVIKYVSVPKTRQPDIASNAATPVTEVRENSAPNASDIMISRRFGKLLNETAKKEVVVTSHDRL